MVVEKQTNNTNIHTLFGKQFQETRHESGLKSKQTKKIVILQSIGNNIEKQGLPELANEKGLATAVIYTCRHSSGHF